ncbi:MAG: hypothetical protein AAF388_00090 [Bacteroidota bacterium]
MPLPASVVPKNPGDPILSENWNDLGAEVNRLDTDKANLSGAVFTGPLEIRSETLISRVDRTPGPRGFQMRYDTTFFGSNRDALVFEKTDLNSTNPTGGIAFVNRGGDGAVQTALTIRGDNTIEIPNTLEVSNVNAQSLTADAINSEIFVRFTAEQDIVLDGLSFGVTTNIIFDDWVALPELTTGYWRLDNEGGNDQVNVFVFRFINGLTRIGAVYNGFQEPGVQFGFRVTFIRRSVFTSIEL